MSHEEPSADVDEGEEPIKLLPESKDSSWLSNLSWPQWKLPEWRMPKPRLPQFLSRQKDNDRSRVANKPRSVR